MMNKETQQWQQIEMDQNFSLALNNSMWLPLSTKHAKQEFFREGSWIHLLYDVQSSRLIQQQIF